MEISINRNLLLSIFVLLFIINSFFFPNIGNCNSLHKKSDFSLTVEEHKLAAKDVDLLEFLTKNRIKSEILIKREKWREGINLKDHITNINNELDVFEYKFIKNSKPSHCQPSYNLFYKNDLVLSELCMIRCFNINKKMNTFFFIASQPIEKGPPYIHDLFFYNGKFQEWDGETCPIFFKNTLMTLVREKKKVSPDYSPQFYVKMGDEIIYSFSTPIIVDWPIKSFFSWNDDWILEYKDTVIINGINIGEKNNYSKIFSYRILNGKPFYFFEQNNRIYISYGGQILPFIYDKVEHYRCCEGAAFNVRGNKNMVWFYAIKEGNWYYVEAGIYD